MSFCLHTSSEYSYSLLNKKLLFKESKFYFVTYQIVIGRILTFLKDPDYRVRIFLARRIGILFRTWDGHTELFHDIW